MTDVSRDRWQAGIDLEREDWATLAWQSGDHKDHHVAPAASTWARRLALVDLSLASFEGQRCLDVGCGPTGLVYFIRAARRVGLDPLADQYEQWNGHWGEPIELVHGEGESMPFNDHSFDAVFCVNCLDHTRDPAQVFSEIGRVLRPGGLLVFQVDLDSPLRKLHKRVRPQIRIMHPHSLSYGWLSRQLTRYFVTEVENRDPAVFVPTRRQMRYEAFWDGLLYRATGSRRWMNHVWVRARRLDE